MTGVYKCFRWLVRFLVAVFLWSHALFFLSPQLTFISPIERTLHFSASEVLLLALLALFSLLAASGFWQMLGNIAYVYFFPFVLTFYAVVGAFLLARSLVRFFGSAPRKTLEVVPPAGTAVAPTSLPGGPEQPVAHAVHEPWWKSLFRPFTRFTILWCLLLLVAKNPVVLWLSFAVVLIHITRAALFLLKLAFRSGTWAAKITSAVRTGIDSTLAKLASVTRDSPATDDLKGLLTSLRGLDKVVSFLSNTSLIEGGVWFLGGLFWVLAYLYIALLFSFAYVGAARIAGFALAWPDSLVTSLFIPFLITGLPKLAWIRLLGGIHCTLVVGVGVGTVTSYIRRQTESVRNTAALITVRMNDPETRERLRILEEKFAEQQSSTTGHTDEK